MNLKHKKRVTSILKWILAVVILTIVFRGMDTETFLTTLGRLNGYKFFLYMTLFVISNFLIDSWSIYSLTRNLSSEVQFRKIAVIRGKTYLLSILHQTLGLGGLGYYIKKKYHLETSAAGSIVLLMFAADAIVLSLTGLIFVLRFDGIPHISFILGVYIGMVFFYSGLLTILTSSKQKKVKFLGEFSQSLRRITKKRLLEFFMIRLFYILSIVTISKFCLELFQVELSFMQLLALMPIAIAAGFLPITPFAIGTYPAALGFFFATWAQSESVFAFGLCYIIGGALLRVPIGLVFWNRN